MVMEPEPKVPLIVADMSFSVVMLAGAEGAALAKYKEPDVSWHCTVLDHTRPVAPLPSTTAPLSANQGRGYVRITKVVQCEKPAYE